MRRLARGAARWGVRLISDDAPLSRSRPLPSTPLPSDQLAAEFETALDDESAGHGIGMEISPPPLCISPDAITFDVLESLLLQLQWLTRRAGVVAVESLAAPMAHCMQIVRANLRQAAHEALRDGVVAKCAEANRREPKLASLFDVLHALARDAPARVARDAVDAICRCLPVFFASPDELMALLEGLLSISCVFISFVCARFIFVCFTVCRSFLSFATSLLVFPCLCCSWPNEGALREAAAQRATAGGGGAAGETTGAVAASGAAERFDR